MIPSQGTLWLKKFSKNFHQIFFSAKDALTTIRFCVIVFRIKTERLDFGMEISI